MIVAARTPRMITTTMISIRVNPPDLRWHDCFFMGLSYRRFPGFLSRSHAVQTNPHPDPLPFPKGEGNHKWHRVRVTEQCPETGALLPSVGKGEAEATPSPL